MSGQDKDDLSRFFRKATRKPEIKFNEDDWTKLEAMLDKASADAVVSSRSRSKKFIAAAVVSLIIVSGTVYFAATRLSSVPYKNVALQASPSPAERDKTSMRSADNKPASNQIASTTISENNSTGDLPVSLPTHDKTSREEQTRHHQQAVLRVERNHVDQFASMRASSYKAQATSQRVLENTRSNTQIINGDSATEDRAGHLKERITKENFIVLTNDDEGDVVNTQKSSSVDESASLQKTSNGIIAATNQSADDLLAPDSTTAQPAIGILKKDSVVAASGKDEEHPDEPVQPSRWSVLLSLAPDFSSNAFRHITSPGEAFGITGYYNVVSGLNVFIGVIGSNKKYVSYGKEYKPKEDHYWSKHTNGMLPTEIDGSCFMLEVPLGIQYTAINMRKNRVLVSAMVSNYTMFNESYTYVFPSENPGAAQGWKSRKTTSYPFSIAGASVSFEHDLSSHLAIGFSPYVKIPLRDMGTWTTMKLYTVGAAFTLRYTFHKALIPIAQPRQQRSG